MLDWAFMIPTVSYRTDVLKLKIGDFNLTKNLNLPQFSVVKDEMPQEKCSLKYSVGQLLIRIGAAP